jgi:hypothetical protein
MNVYRGLSGGSVGEGRERTQKGKKIEIKILTCSKLEVKCLEIYFI